MASLRGKTAIVTGASSGVGKATAKLLVSEGARVTAVARGAEGLAALRSECLTGLDVVPADAADPTTAARLVRALRPEIIVLAAGVRPRMAPLDEQSWESFNEVWVSDLKATFHFLQEAIRLPLPPGSSFVTLSSGAAINGSHLSGGYAGAKRMQWMLAGYAQQLADAKKLGIRFQAVLPKQLIEGTPIGENAAAAYGALQGTSGADFMKRFEVPLDADKVGAAIVGSLRGEVAAGATAFAVTGKGVELLG